MKNKYIFLILLCLLTGLFTEAQPGIISVNLAPFSSDKYDEFSPVYYKNGIVFCTNRGRSYIFNYSPSDNRGLFNISFADTSGKDSWRDSKIFSKDLKTSFNDGPVSFNKRGDTIYFSRNLVIDSKLRDLNDNRNKLGIFFSVLTGNSWTKVRELRINNEWYNVTTPWLSPDSRRLYFASDKPGGYGGSDLYFCNWTGDYWDDPVNLGPVINTSRNEAYPYVISNNEIFFSSDGHPGLGGKDIFYSKLKDSNWQPPVPLDSPINSESDDFGFVADSLLTAGYFSSNRGKSIDIYSFTTEFPQIYYAESQRTNQYCFRFSDKEAIEFDNRRFQYEWNFGDGHKTTGDVVEHCYSGPGKYEIQLNLVERSTGKVVILKSLYSLILKDVEQPFISCTDTAIPGVQIDFNGLKSNLPGLNVVGYTWDFGDGARANGAQTNHIYTKPGEYNVILGIRAYQPGSSLLSQFAVSKKIFIGKEVPGKPINTAKKTGNQGSVPDIDNYDYADFNVRYSAADEILKGAVFQVQVMSSVKKLSFENPALKQFSPKYRIKEIFNKETGLYSYIISEELSLMAAYPVLTDAIAMGAKDARIKTALITDPGEYELNTLKRVYGLSEETFFDKTNNRITTAGFALLDQIVNLMNKYPEIKLLIEVYSDEQGTDWFNQNVSQKRAESMLNYLAGRSINKNRLSATGYGRSRRISIENTETARKMNRRVQFRIIN